MKSDTGVTEQTQIKSQIFPILRIQIATPFLLYIALHIRQLVPAVIDTLVKVQETPLECLHPLVQQIKKELIFQFCFCSTSAC